jgi:hypothetical protein
MKMTKQVAFKNYPALSNKSSAASEPLMNIDIAFDNLHFFLY